MSLPKFKFMKSILLTVIVSAGLVAPLLADDTNVLGDPKMKASYALGMMLGRNWQQQSIEIDPDVLLRGLKDQQSGTAMLTVPEMQATLKAYQQTVAAKQAKVRAEMAEKNMAAGDAFLATNKNDPAVITSPDGLQYKVITKGTGATPNLTDMVTVNYTGMFLDGTEFDSSAKSKRPAQFQVNHVVAGMTEALTNMPTGSKWRLYIPSRLAYGERGTRNIPPNSTLIFDLELVGIQPPPPVAQPLTSDIIKVPSADEMKKGAKIETLKAEDVQKMQTNAVPQ